MRRWVAEHPGWPDQGRQLWEEAEEACVTRHTWQSMQNRWRRYLKRGASTGAPEPARAVAVGTLDSASPRPPADRIRRSLARSPRAQGQAPAVPRAQRAKRWASPFGPAPHGQVLTWEPSLRGAEHSTHSPLISSVPARASIDLLCSPAGPHTDEDSSVAECSPGSEVVTPAPVRAKRACAERVAAQCAAFVLPMQQRRRLGDQPASCDGELLAHGEIQHILLSAPQWLQEKQLDVHIDPKEL